MFLSSISISVESVFVTLSVVDSMSKNLLGGVSELWWDCHNGL